MSKSRARTAASSGGHTGGCSLLLPGGSDLSCSSAGTIGSSGAGISPSQAGEPAAGPHVGLHVLLGEPAHMSTHEGPPALQWSWPVFTGCGPSSLLVGRALLPNDCMQSPHSFPILETFRNQVQMLVWSRAVPGVSLHPSPFMRPQWARPGHWGWVGGLQPTTPEPSELFTSPTAPQAGQLLLFLNCL